MPITMLDPRTALIVIDLQNGIVAMPTVHPIDTVIGRARLLIGAFRRHGLPVVLVNVDGRPPGRTDLARTFATASPGWADFDPGLDRRPGDHVVTKKTAGAFTRTALEAYLNGHGVTQVVIVGVATSMGVEATARQAHELGFNVTLAVDAMTDLDADAHANSVGRIFPRLAETGTTQAILDLLAPLGAA